MDIELIGLFGRKYYFRREKASFRKEAKRPNDPAVGNAAPALHALAKQIL